jgi:nucleotide-binding universal stress UspA family protein
VYQHILVALDGSELAEHILPHVEALATKFGSRVTLLRATESIGTIVAETTPGSVADGGAYVDPRPILEAEQGEAHSYLAPLAERLKAQGLNVDFEVPEGPASDAILRRAHEMRADLIAMTTHGHGGLGRLVFGSEADRVLRRSACPVLLVRVHHGGTE